MHFYSNKKVKLWCICQRMRSAAALFVDLNCEMTVLCNSTKRIKFFSFEKHIFTNYLKMTFWCIFTAFGKKTFFIQKIFYICYDCKITGWMVRPKNMKKLTQWNCCSQRQNELMNTSVQMTAVLAFLQQSKTSHIKQRTTSCYCSFTLLIKQVHFLMISEKMKIVWPILHFYSNKKRSIFNLIRGRSCNELLCIFTVFKNDIFSIISYKDEYVKSFLHFYTIQKASSLFNVFIQGKI